MRSSVVLSLALLAAAAPSIAAPISSGSYEPPVMKRQASSSTTSIDSSLTTDETGAFGWTSLIGPAISAIGSIFGNHNKRELEDFVTRSFHEDVAREIMARADDETGAFGWTSLIGPAISAIGSIFGNHNKREVNELFVRAFQEEFARELMTREDDETGAFGWTSLIGPAISAIGSIFGNHNKREVNELFVRAFQEEFARELMTREDDETGAFGWTSLIGPAISAIGSIFGNHNKREVNELFVRTFQEEFARELMTRGDDETGAFGWTSLIGPAISVIGSIFGNHNKREINELFTRALQEEFARELMARADGEIDETGAFGWTSLIGPAISVISNIFGNHNKRDFEDFLQQREFVARSLYDLD